ncbi:MAG: CRISPR system precrRNA processing endoribonuclease RAMP protein Cas6 [Candidatus Omnitrophica bacterium]|nr:CRISPR system precrRNA processing endoribonuclease RAMP protein Cas6 [Candidatus Omnitrophota bacterium]
MIEYFPYLILTLKKMGEKGIGIKNRRGNFIIRNIKSDNTTVYDGEKEILYPYKNPQKITLPQKDVKAVSLEFLSPTRIKSDGKLTKDLPFSLLVKTLLRRLSLLKKNYCESSDFTINYEKIKETAREVETVSCNLKWYDWERFSTRQNTRMKLGGFLGKITYLGNLGDFLQYLKVGELIHIGKNASFGLGKYAIIRYYDDAEDWGDLKA